MRERPSLVARAFRFVARAAWAAVVTGADVDDPRPRREPPARPARRLRRDHDHPIL